MLAVSVYGYFELSNVVSNECALLYLIVQEFATLFITIYRFYLIIVDCVRLKFPTTTEDVAIKQMKSQISNAFGTLQRLKNPKPSKRRSNLATKLFSAGETSVSDTGDSSINMSSQENLTEDEALSGIVTPATSTPSINRRDWIDPTEDGNFSSSPVMHLK